MKKTIKLSIYDIELEIILDEKGEPTGSGAILKSSLKENCTYCGKTDCTETLATDEEKSSRNRFNDMMDVVESMILAHACAGIDVESPAYLEGAEIVIDKICNEN